MTVVDDMVIVLNSIGCRVVNRPAKDDPLRFIHHSMTGKPTPQTSHCFTTISSTFLFLKSVILCKHLCKEVYCAVAGLVKLDIFLNNLCNLLSSHILCVNFVNMLNCALNCAEKKYFAQPKRRDLC